METRNSKIGCLILLSSALATAAHAQLTVNPDGVWLESTTGLNQNAGSVSSWVDQANALSFTPQGADGAPAYVAQSDLPSQLPSVSFTAGTFDIGNHIFHDQRLQVDSVASSLFSSGGPQGTIFIVEKPSTPDPTYGQTSFGWRDNPDASASSQLVGRQDVSGNIINAHGQLSQTLNAAPPSGFYGSWHVITISRSGGSGFIRVDGNTESFFTTEWASPGPSGTGSALVGTDLYNGQIAAVLVYSTALDGSDILATESYLQNKYLTVVPEPSQYAMVFSLACVAGVVVMRYRRAKAA
jgi:hypothetical protein